MKTTRPAMGALLLLALLAAAPVHAQVDAERLRAAKTLFFDRKYTEARQAWATLADAKGPEAEAAAFWMARCSENLGDSERALGEYNAYLNRRPADPALAQEARTSRVGLAARLYKAGEKGHLPILKEALGDPSKTVRYYAAFQLGGLGPDVGQPAVPVLKHILEEEKDEDLVERAKIYLLRLDPGALTRARPVPGLAPRDAGWLRVRIYSRGQSRPEVSINLPMALAEMVFKSLPDEVRTELGHRGYEAGKFWEQLKKLRPAEILSIEGKDGDRVQIWIE
jgi:tetratricopeptide (TPR) repeat protein